MMTLDEIEKLVQLIEDTEDEVTRTILRKLLATEVELRGRIPMSPSPMQWTVSNHCPKCGIELTGTMCYSCPNVECPTGMGPTVC